MPPRCTPTSGQHLLHLAPADAVVSQRHLHVEQDVGGLPGDLLWVVVLAGHHELSTFLADFLEDELSKLFDKFEGDDEEKPSEEE